MNKPTNIPDWDLGSIYPDINSEKYKSDLAKLTEGIKTLKALNDQAENPDQKNHLNIQNWIADFFKADDILGPLANTLAAYSYSIYSVDTTSKSLLDNLNQVESLTDQYEIQLNRFSHTVSKNRGILSEFYANFPQYRKYEFSINEMLEDDIHTLSPELEGIIAKLQQTGGRAWDRLHEQLISNLKDPETGKLFNELRNDAYSPDARLRKESWQKEIALLKQNEIAFAASLNNLKGETLSLLEERSWNCAIDRALSSSRMKKETLDALIAAIEESLPQWRKYLKAKAEYLKNHNATASTNCVKEKGLAFYDLFAPLDGNTSSDGNTNTAGQTETGCNTATPSATNNRAASEESLLSKNWTFEEARDYIIKEFTSF